MSSIKQTTLSLIILSILAATASAYNVNLTLKTGEVRYFAQDVLMLKLDLVIDEYEEFAGDVYLAVVDPNGSVFFAPGWQQTPTTLLSNFNFPKSIDIKSALIVQTDIPNRTFPMGIEGDYTFAIGIAEAGTTNFLDIATCKAEYKGDREWFVINEDDGLADYILEVIDDRNGGGYWFGVDMWDGDYTLYHYKDKIVKGYNYKNSGVGEPFISGMVYDSQDTLWISSFGICKYVNTDDKFVDYFPPEDLYPYGKLVNSMVYGGNNNLWLGTLNGLGCFDIEDESWMFYEKKDGLLVNQISDIEFDFDGNLWIVCNNSDTAVGGVCKFDGENFENFAHPPYFKNYTFHHIGIDSEGCVWIGGEYSDNYVYRYVDEHWIKYTEADGLPTIKVTSFYLDRFGKFWCATLSKEEGPVQFIDGVWLPAAPEIHKLGIKVLYNIYQDSENNYWFVGSRGIAIRWGSD